MNKTPFSLFRSLKYIFCVFCHSYFCIFLLLFYLTKNLTQANHAADKTKLPPIQPTKSSQKKNSFLFIFPPSYFKFPKRPFPASGISPRAKAAVIKTLWEFAKARALPPLASLLQIINERLTAVISFFALGKTFKTSKNRF